MNLLEAQYQNQLKLKFQLQIQTKIRNFIQILIMQIDKLKKDGQQAILAFRQLMSLAFSTNITSGIPSNFSQNLDHPEAQNLVTKIILFQNDIALVVQLLEKIQFSLRTSRTQEQPHQPKRGYYNRYTDFFKRIVIQTVQKNNWTMNQAGLYFGIPSKNVFRWCNKGYTKKKGGGRKSLDEAMELKIYDWLKLCLSSNIIVTSYDIRNKAIQYSSFQNFKASKGWLDKFRARFKLPKFPNNLKGEEQGVRHFLTPKRMSAQMYKDRVLQKQLRIQQNIQNRIQNSQNLQKGVSAQHNYLFQRINRQQEQQSSSEEDEQYENQQQYGQQQQNKNINSVKIEADEENKIQKKKKQERLKRIKQQKIQNLREQQKRQNEKRNQIKQKKPKKIQQKEMVKKQVQKKVVRGVGRPRKNKQALNTGDISGVQQNNGKKRCRQSGKKILKKVGQEYKNDRGGVKQQQLQDYDKGNKKRKVEVNKELKVVNVKRQEQSVYNSREIDNNVPQNEHMNLYFNMMKQEQNKQNQHYYQNRLIKQQISNGQLKDLRLNIAPFTSPQYNEINEQHSNQANQSQNEQQIEQQHIYNGNLINISELSRNGMDCMNKSKDGMQNLKMIQKLIKQEYQQDRQQIKQGQVNYNKVQQGQQCKIQQNGYLYEYGEVLFQRR